MAERFITMAEARERTSLSKTEIYRRIAAGSFPNVTLDPGKVADFIGQARQVLPLLPEPTRNSLAPILDQAEAEIKNPSGDPSRLRGMLESAKSACEGAVGNLAASGIVEVIARMLGG